MDTSPSSGAPVNSPAAVETVKEAQAEMAYGRQIRTGLGPRERLVAEL